MDSQEFEIKCKNIIYDYYKKLNIEIFKNHIFVVWSCKTLQNNKMLASTTVNDSRYFELTYDGNYDKIYFDSYVKEFNKTIRF